MDKPTEAQIKEFWEWCGLRSYPDCECIRTKGICWGTSEETYGENGHWHFVLPAVDLTNLFKYAVPSLRETLTQADLLNVLYGWCSNEGYFRGDNEQTLALFWSIWEVINAR